jgi:hypothetical protein
MHRSSSAEQLASIIERTQMRVTRRTDRLLGASCTVGAATVHDAVPLQVLVVSIHRARVVRAALRSCGPKSPVRVRPTEWLRTHA